MKEILLLLDYLCPLFFFLLGRTLAGEKRRILVNESIFSFSISLLFAPIVYRWFSLSVNSAFSAGILFLQFFLLSLALIKCQRKKILL